MFERSHTEVAPWTVVLAEDKRRARIGVMQTVLAAFDYAAKTPMTLDPKIVGGPELILGALASGDGRPDARPDARHCAGGASCAARARGHLRASNGDPR